MKDRLKHIICALFRHSVITKICFGYQHCGRCDALLGDTIAGAFSVTVGLSCGCEECQSAYASLGLVDKFLVPKPEWLGWTPKDWKAHCDQKRKQLMTFLENENRRMRNEIASRSLVL